MYEEKSDDELAAIALCVANIESLTFTTLFDINEQEIQVTIKGIRALAQGISNRSKPVSYQHENVFIFNGIFSNISCSCFHSFVNKMENRVLL